MKKAFISDACAACGFCFTESSLFTELPTGKPVPTNNGIVAEKDVQQLLNLVNSCPMQAISLTDDEIQEIGAGGIVELKEMIEKKLVGYKMPPFAYEKYNYIEGTYHISVSAPQIRSSYQYSIAYIWDTPPEAAGLVEFSANIFAQQKAMVQALLIAYKTDKLRDYAYVEENPNNYYYRCNQEVHQLLEEMQLRAVELSEGKISLPENFCIVNVGPDVNYQGDTACYPLRHLEKQEYLMDNFEGAEYYKTYINSDILGDKSRYDLSKAIEKFREHVDCQVSWAISSHVINWVYEAIDLYEKELRNLILEKTKLIKAELKKCKLLDTPDVNSIMAIKKELKSLCKQLHETELSTRTTFHHIDTNYNSDFRFISRRECEKAATNRANRFDDNCKSYLSPRYSPNISEDLAELYAKQITKVFSDIRLNIQRIYDKYETEYPQKSVEISAEFSMIVDIAGFDEISYSDISRNIEDFIDEKIIGPLGKISTYKYLKCMTYEIAATTDWKTGLFGQEIEFHKYGYLLQSDQWTNGFDEACKDACDFTFEDGYLQSQFTKLKANFAKEITEKLIGLKAK